MAKYRMTGSIVNASGEREDVKIVDRAKAAAELVAIERMNGSVLMPTDAERAAIAASRAYDATFIDDSFDDDDDFGDVSEEEIERTIREALSK